MRFVEGEARGITMIAVAVVNKYNVGSNSSPFSLEQKGF